MNGIPVLTAVGHGLAQAWESSMLRLHHAGCDLQTQYDRPGDPPSIDATMLITVEDPLSEPMIHMDLPGGMDDLQEYTMEVLDGIKDHLVRDPNDPDDMRWQYTYHQRLFQYSVPGFSRVYDQIEDMCQQVAKTPFTRRAQAVTWKVWEDSSCDDPACLQSVWCRVIPDSEGEWFLSMNVRFRSRDAYKAAMMNMFALIMLQDRIRGRIAELAARPVFMGRYCDFSDSYHIYGKDLKEFRARFLGQVAKRTFEQRTIRYEDVKEYMLGAKNRILRKAAKMARVGVPDEKL